MTPKRWQKVKELCYLALEQEPGQRIEFLAAACPNDQPLRREVESLMARATAGEGILPGAFWGELGGKAAGGAAVTSQTDQRIPPCVGSYGILRILGEGGMGVVYEAEQDHPRRIVALKVIKPGFVNKELLRRFELESQVLGRLHHLGIAQIYEAGTADGGDGPQPYFAMEYIQGARLSEYVQSHHLNTRQCLELVAKVCDGVEHAHQHGIIHRDLKPGNILVEENGQPKILDFGVARVTDSDLQATRQTDVGQLIGTLAYMSPEQVLADPLELDTRSDVYALGVILYELLAGKHPYALSKRLHEAVRTIREEDPSRLSSIDGEYRGDIETIVAKALQKDKTRRYASAAAVADDIRRYLADQPITARPASTTYQLQKFARRHKALVGATAAVFVVLVAGIVVSTREALLARRAEQTAQAVNDFLQNDLLAQASAATQAGPSTKPDPDLKVRTALDRAAAQVAGKFQRQPEVEGAIRDTIGQTYMDLGVYPEARKQLERALVLQRRMLGAENPRTLKTMSRLGWLAGVQGNVPEAETLFKQALEIQRQVLGPEHPDTLASGNGLAGVYVGQGKYTQAERLDTQVLETRRRVLGPEHHDTLRSMNNLALVYSYQGKDAQAEALYRQTLEIQRRVLGPEHPDALSSMFNLAAVYSDQGKYAQAESLLNQSLEIQRRVLGPEHPDTLGSMQNLANNYLSQGQYAQAEVLDSQTLEIRRRVLGPEFPDTLYSMNQVAEDYSSLGKFAPAEALFKETLAVTRRVLGPEHPDTFLFLTNFASMYQRQGKYSLAEAHAAQALAGRRHSLGTEHPDTMAAAADLALAHQSLGKFDESEPLAREALEFYRKNRPDDWQRFRADSLLGASLVGRKKYTEAEPLLLEGYQGMAVRKDRMGVPNWYHLERAREWIVQMYQTWGKSEKAAEWLKK